MARWWAHLPASGEGSARETAAAAELPQMSV